MEALKRELAAAEKEGIEIRQVPVNGLNYNYARKGKGKGFPLILLHGWPEFWLVWRQVMNLLGDEFDLIAPDMRGAGDTGKAVDGPDNTANAVQHADDIAVFADALGLDRFGVVGGDLGAYVAQAFGRKYADRATGLFFFCTPYPGSGQRYGSAEHLIEVWYQYFNQMPWAADLVGSSREACRIYISHFLDHWSGDDPEVFDSIREAYIDNFMKPGNIQGGFDWYVSSAPNRRLWIEERLPIEPKITVPSFMLWGKRDPLIKADWCDRLGEYFEDYAIEFADAGHFVHYQVPEVAAEKISSFFSDKQE